MSILKNVAIAGASGNVGSVLLPKLIANGNFNVRVLRRAGSDSVYPDGAEVVDMDYSSPDSVKAALAGQDAVISLANTTGLDSQIALIDAAVEAGVKRFLPSEFGCDTENPNARKLPVFAPKIKTHDYLKQKAATTPLTYTLVFNSAFLDWGLEQQFIFKTSGETEILDGGDLLFSSTTLGSIADGVIGVLTHPEETKNRTVHIHDVVTSQNKLLALAKKVAPNKEWKTVNVKIDDLIAKADARLAQHLYDAETFIPYLFRAIFDPAYGSKFETTDNELLGVKGKTDEDIIELLKPLVSL